MGSIRYASGAYYIRFKENGKWHEKKSHPTLPEAREHLVRVEARILDGKVGVEEPTPEALTRATVTVGELATRFVGDKGYAPPKVKDLEAYRRNARTVLNSRVAPIIGKRAAADVSTLDVEQLRDGLKLAPSSVMQTLAILSKLYNWARKTGLVDCINPVIGVERPTPAPSLDYLSASEVAALIASVEESARLGVASWQTLALWPMVVTAIFCGPRKGELLGLRWTDVKLDVARLDIWRSYKLLPKSGKPRHVPIHPDLVTVLRVWQKLCPKTTEGLVFPVEAEPGRFRMGAKEDMCGLLDALTRAECHLPADGHPWHMLRHTFAAHAVMAGAGLYAVQRLLGHATPVLTQRYAHLAPDFMAAEVAKMSFARPTMAGISDLAEARRKGHD